jgi:hypothetical protein
MTKRFLYNPESKKFYIFTVSHSEYFYNNFRSLESKKFDDYIRGIITEENKILLRVYYPYENISELSFVELVEKSLALIHLNLDDIKTALIDAGIKADDFIFNVTNESAKDILKTCYV